jgi:hypothetical protein
MKVLSTCKPFQSRSKPTASFLSTSFSRAESNQEVGSVFLSGSQIGIAGRRASQEIFWVQPLLKIITYLHRLNRCPCESQYGIWMIVVSFTPRPLRPELQPTVPTYWDKRFSFVQEVQTDSGAHPVSVQWVEVALSLRVKRPGSDADHSSPPSAEIKNEHSYISSSSTCLHVVYMYTFTMSPIEKYDRWPPPHP